VYTKRKAQVALLGEGGWGKTIRSTYKVQKMLQEVNCMFLFRKPIGPEGNYEDDMMSVVWTRLLLF
jgi:hypothetical protein